MPEDQNRTLQDKFMLRMPAGMRALIKSSADSNSRSMNAEIIHRLEQSFEQETEFEIREERSLAHRMVLEQKMHDVIWNRFLKELGENLPEDVITRIIRRLDTDPDMNEHDS